MSFDAPPAAALVIEDIAETRAWLSGIASEALPAARIEPVATLAEARTVIEAGPLALVLVDLRLPDGSGIDAIRTLRASEAERGGHRAVCVVTTILGGDADIVAALAAGADGYVTKDVGQETILDQLRLALSGVPALSPAVARRIMSHFAATGPTAPEGLLTRREREVLGLIGSGLRNAEAAETLGISAETVSGHVKAIYAKLGISSRAEAAWHAASMGLGGPLRR